MWQITMDLNTFYCRFDEVDYSEQQTRAIDRIKDLSDRDITITIDDVRKQFSQLHNRKSEWEQLQGLEGMH